MKRQTAAERYASVFVAAPTPRSLVRAEREAVLEEAARLVDAAGCVWCEETGEAHLHGSVLFEEGRRLF